MAGYVCKNCGFRTEARADRCPYCDKKGLEREKSADELLSSLDEE